ncbi:L-arabinose ABC transporter ATP-binding protein AraG, partial [Klebsiella pneumoniae]|nr:L-arabinose ABC transporter ATP-binding protein AraG [Klebsiella pneumoniae]
LRLEVVLARCVRSPVCLSVRSGDIVGLFGLVGAGRIELMKGLFVCTQKNGGQVYNDGQPVSIRNQDHAIQAGKLLCPEDL